MDSWEVKSINLVVLFVNDSLLYTFFPFPFFQQCLICSSTTSSTATATATAHGVTWLYGNTSRASHANGFGTTLLHCGVVFNLRPFLKAAEAFTLDFTLVDYRRDTGKLCCAVLALFLTFRKFPKFMFQNTMQQNAANLTFSFKFISLSFLLVGIERKRDSRENKRTVLINKYCPSVLIYF